MKLTRKSKIVIAVVALVVIILAAFIALPPLRTMVFGGPILKFGGFGNVGGGLLEIFCGNGTMFYETTDALGKEAVTVYYNGQLSPADLADLKGRLGMSFVLDQNTQPASEGNINTSVGGAFAEYTGGGLITRSVTYQEYLSYGKVISDFEKKIMPAKGKDKVQDSYWHIPPMIVVPSVDCKPR